MSNTVTISCILNTTDPAATLGFEVWVDDTKFIDIEHVQNEQPVAMEIPDDSNGEYELRFILKNKTAEHTRLDTEKNVISDARLTVTDLMFDGIKLGHKLTELAVYNHDFNGTGSAIQEKFYSEIGCNGTVSLKFFTPLYLWLLEHM
jgi:hypothetical protein